MKCNLSPDLQKDWPKKYILRGVAGTLANRATKSLNNPKIKSKSNVRIEGNKENENYYTL